MDRQQHIRLALSEDQYKKDITTKILQLDKNCKAIIKAKESFHIYGLKWFSDVFKSANKSTKIKLKVKDGDLVKKNMVIAEIYGTNHALLNSERVALNYLQTMSGTYDKCIRFKKKITNKKIQLLHTRKTIPLYRLPLSEACKAAGCAPHRYDLSSSILIKENHLKLAAKPVDLIAKAIKKNKIVIVEAKTLKFAKTVSNLKISRILLDNFTPAMLQSFISSKPKVKIEISGSVNLNNINKFAMKGIHYISIGDLTKNIESKDLSMLIV